MQDAGDLFGAGDETADNLMTTMVIRAVARRPARACDDRGVDAAARVCPFCGEPPGPGVFCAVCGRNLADVRQLPTRLAWERERAGTPDPDRSSTRASAADAVAAFVAAMHRAGDPGAADMPLADPGFLGRTKHVRGWVVRAVDRDDDDPPSVYEPGLFVTVEGHLHRLDRATRGLGQRAAAGYVDSVGPEVGEPAHDERLAGELAAVLRASGLDSESP